jgi:[ribosomal protein S5]-alanine N-acetyltransferase
MMEGVADHVPAETLLHTKRLALRPAVSSDLEFLVRTAEGSDTSRIAPFLDASLTWWTAYRYGLWIVDRKDAAVSIGWCGLRPEERPQQPELMYGIASKYRGQGFATEAARAVLRYALSRSEVTDVWAATPPTHLASVRVMEKSGLSFKRRTRLDGVDSVIYAIERSRP